MNADRAELSRALTQFAENWRDNATRWSDANLDRYASLLAYTSLDDVTKALNGWAANHDKICNFYEFKAALQAGQPGEPRPPGCPDCDHTGLISFAWHYTDEHGTVCAQDRTTAACECPAGNWAARGIIRASSLRERLTASIAVSRWACEGRDYRRLTPADRLTPEALARFEAMVMPASDDAVASALPVGRNHETGQIARLEAEIARLRADLASALASALPVVE